MMKPLLPLLLLTLCLCSCDPASNPDPAVETTPPAAPTPEFDAATRSFVPGERFGAIVAGATLDDLKAIYGADLQEGTIYGPEGMTLEGMILFPGQDDEVEIITGEDADGMTFRIQDAGGAWHDARTGLRVGSSLLQLQRIAGEPFDFSGFGWDYGGAVHPIDERPWLDNLGIELREPFYLAPEDMEFMLGDITVSTADERLDDLRRDIRVRRLHVHL